MLEKNMVYNCDCIEGMKLLDDNSIDMVLTDPPFCYDEYTEILTDKYISVIQTKYYGPRFYYYLYQREISRRDF